MPRLKGIDINYDQIRELVCQLEFKKKMSLKKRLLKKKATETVSILIRNPY